ncbi:MAG: phosphotransferase [Erysipelotrichaceae bacterium]|nr:phosphotransferase [Erysipelotrichaceae bacterium]
MNIQTIKEILPESHRYRSFDLIQKGWSFDYKFKLKDTNNQNYLLRVSDIKEYEHKKYEYEILNHPLLLNSNIIKPIEIGITLDKKYCYTLSKWIDGNDLEDSIEQYPEDIQYELGYKAGQILRQIHSIEINTDNNWNIDFQNKIDRKIVNALNCSLQLNKLEIYLKYIEQSRHLLSNRPMSFQHGDFHIGNTLIDINGKIVLIDFNRHDIGDPWEEFNRIPLSAKVSGAYASGCVDGYFDNNIPGNFFPLLALYIAVNQISSLPWAIQFGDTEINFMRELSDQILDWYDDFNTNIPSWYKSIKTIK